MRTLLAAAVLVGALAAPATATAEPAALTLKYQCQFPLLGAQPVLVRISSDLPRTVETDRPLPPIVVAAVATVSARSVQGLDVVGARTLEGTASASVTVRSPGGTLPLRVPTTIARAELPPSGTTDVTARGQAPSIRFSRPGTARISVGDLLLTLTPRLPDGTPTGLDTFESECVQEPDQPNDLAVITVTDPGGDRRYTATGTATLRSGSAPLTGTLDTGDLALDPAQADVRLLGFLPAKADLRLEPQGKLTGPDDGPHTVRLATRVPSVTAFGLPLGGGDTCRTAPADVTFHGRLDPASGGDLKATPAPPPLTGCGPLTGLLADALTATALDLRLTPAKES